MVKKSDSVEVMLPITHAVSGLTLKQNYSVTEAMIGLR